ncbi:MAG TPA: nucleotide exchange factor GrpE [Candidatus Sulfotelmatobacter sp.]|nr:nucleotide exchange factor GrpE [Candidatus Sulfotelmatobacter sp.]
MHDDTATTAPVDATVTPNGAGQPGGEGDLAAELTAARAKAEENYNKFLYAMADFENYKKRIERQLAEIALAGRRAVLVKMLPVLDNLERALAFDDSEGLRGGLQATLRQFEAALESENVKPVTVKGLRFDPKLAEAIATQPAPAGVAEDTVLEEARKGYTIGDEVLRPAQVVVAKGHGS